MQRGAGALADAFVAGHVVGGDGRAEVAGVERVGSVTVVAFGVEARAQLASEELHADDVEDGEEEQRHHAEGAHRRHRLDEGVDDLLHALEARDQPQRPQRAERAQGLERADHLERGHRLGHDREDGDDDDTEVEHVPARTQVGGHGGRLGMDEAEHDDLEQHLDDEGNGEKPPHVCHEDLDRPRVARARVIDGEHDRREDDEEYDERVEPRVPHDVGRAAPHRVGPREDEARAVARLLVGRGRHTLAPRLDVVILAHGHGRGLAAHLDETRLAHLRFLRRTVAAEGVAHHGHVLGAALEARRHGCVQAAHVILLILVFLLLLLAVVVAVLKVGEQDGDEEVEHDQVARDEEDEEEDRRLVPTSGNADGGAHLVSHGVAVGVESQGEIPLFRLDRSHCEGFSHCSVPTLSGQASRSAALAGLLAHREAGLLDEVPLGVGLLVRQQVRELGRRRELVSLPRRRDLHRPRDDGGRVGVEPDLVPVLAREDDEDGEEALAEGVEVVARRPVGEGDLLVLGLAREDEGVVLGGVVVLGAREAAAEELHAEQRPDEDEEQHEDAQVHDRLERLDEGDEDDAQVFPLAR